MKTRRLGRSQIMVPPVIFGGNVFGWTADEKTSFGLLDALMDAGLCAIDTADVYSTWVPGHRGGESETVIGDWLAARGNRDKVVIATKVGMRIGDQEGLSPDWIERAAEASLRRLRTDHIDLYQAHIDDASVPLEESLGAFSRLIDAGKVRAIGCSNFTASRLRQVIEVCDRSGLPRFESVQPHYNLIHRHEFEDELAGLCLDKQVGAIGFFGLAAGFLAGKYRSKADLEGKSRATRVAALMTERNLAILDTLAIVAREENTTMSSAAIAWLISRPALTAPIVSATSPAQLDEIRHATTLTLSAASLEVLDRCSA